MTSLRASKRMPRAQTYNAHISHERFRWVLPRPGRETVGNTGT